MEHGFLDAYARLDTPVHRLDARVKLVAALAFVLAAVSTPATAYPAFASYALFLAAVLLLSRLPLRHVLSRLAVVLPFVGAVAAFIPFLPPDSVSGGYSLGAYSLETQRSAWLIFWNVLVKSLLGAAAVILLTSTTPFPRLLEGLARLRVPRLLTMMLSFAYRYLFVLVEEAQRMKRARDARCYSGRWLWQARVIGQLIGTLFLRSYERGERVYLAMAARGYNAEFKMQNSKFKMQSGETADAKPAAESQEQIIKNAKCKMQNDGAAPVAAYALELNALSYSYPDGTPALKEVSFRVAAGERVALVGANGAGKSTLLLHFNGIIASNTVRVAGLAVTAGNLKAVRQKVGLVFQNPDDQLFCPTVFEDVAFGPRNLGLGEDEVARRVSESLAQVGLEGFERRSAFHLSIGEKRRAALATVLALRPDVLVLDEPTAHLDPRGRRELAGLLERVGGTQLVATHDLELARRLCGRTVVLKGGRVTADGTTETLLGDEELLKTHDLA